MARIQILELPTIFEGDSETTPFVLVIDQVETDGEVRAYSGDIVTAQREEINATVMKEATGAVGVIVHTGTLDVA